MAREYQRHGMSGHPLYNRWKQMIYRCHREKYAKYTVYGALGVEVCAAWRTDFGRFLDDVGLPPSPLHSLDRIDVRGNYEPNNVRWATQAVQQRNRRNNIHVTFGDRTMVLKDWCTELRLPYETVKERYHAGWTPEAAVYYGRYMTTERLRDECAKAWDRCFPNGSGDCYLR